MLRFKVDEDLPAEIAALLRDARHDAMTVHEQSLSGTTDGDLWPIVQREGRCLVTADKGFADARQHPPGTHAGIVLLRHPHESRAGYLQLMRAFLASGKIEVTAGAITAVTPDMVRVHR